MTHEGSVALSEGGQARTSEDDGKWGGSKVSKTDDETIEKNENRKIIFRVS